MAISASFVANAQRNQSRPKSPGFANAFFPTDEKALGSRKRSANWRVAVLGCADRGDAMAICTKLLNSTAAISMVAKSERMEGAGDLRIWGRTLTPRNASFSGLWRLHKDDDAETSKTSPF